MTSLMEVIKRFGGNVLKVMTMIYLLITEQIRNEKDFLVLIVQEERKLRSD